MLICVDVFLQITGDPVKLGLGAASLIFDAVMMVQHFILYGPKDVSYERLHEEGCAISQCSDREPQHPS